MSNLATLKPFVKGDPRINRKGTLPGSFSLTKAVKEFLKVRAKDGKTYGDKLKEAAVFRAIKKSDKLVETIWNRTDPEDDTGKTFILKIKR